eukprot:15448640-Alexandrium_andersonii.AAC.1
MALRDIWSSDVRFCDFLSADICVSCCVARPAYRARSLVDGGQPPAAREGAPGRLRPRTSRPRMPRGPCRGWSRVRLSTLSLRE